VFQKTSVVEKMTDATMHEIVEVIIMKKQAQPRLALHLDTHNEMLDTRTWRQSKFLM
jgi:hypothetical protein